MTRDELGREWRQFRLLSRDSVRRLINTAVLARDTDPLPFAGWGIALVSTPPAMYAFGQLFLYSSLRRAPVPVFERVVLGHRMFFIVYAMLATSLLAALLWEALFPDRIDQEFIGPLPVRPRTLAAARLAAAVTVAITYAACISLPGGIMFALSSAAHPLAGSFPAVLAAHVIASMLGCLTIFLLLLLVRGLVAIALGWAVADRLATVLQFTTITGLVEALFYLPSLLPLLVRHMLAADAGSMGLPPVWFAALYSWLLGFGHAALAAEARVGMLVLLGAAVTVVPLYLLSAEVMARRALESASRDRPGLLTIATRAACRMLAVEPVGRAILQFTLISLVRNRRHLLVLVSYAGAGVAIGFVTVLASQIRGTWAIARPERYLLGLPLVLIFFLTVGLRAVFTIPTDLQANWVFRLSRPHTAHAVAATRKGLWMLSTAPIALLSGAAAALLGWPLSAVLLIIAFDLMAGALLVEYALLAWRTVPFTSAHTTSPDTIRSRWLLMLPPFLLFAIGGASLQLTALRSQTGALTYVVIAGGAWLMVRLMSARDARRLTVQFEPPAHDAQLQILNLSEATH